MWNAAIACMFCFVVGAVISLLYKPQDPKKLNPELISPGLYSMFSFWPKPVRDFWDNLEVGKDFVSL